MTKKPQHIECLIVRFLTGEATREEKQELATWLNASESNRKYFEEYEFVNTKIKPHKKDIKFDVDRAWNRVKANIKQESPTHDKPRKARILTLPTWLKVAAMLVMLAGISWVVVKIQKTISAPAMVTIASKDSIITENFNDESVVTLNRDSYIRYCEDYGKDKRLVELKGEAFFKVKSIPEQPFLVKAVDTYIEQTGTSFNVKACPTDTLIEVYVKTGNVKLYQKNNHGLEISEGETGIYNKNNKEFTKSSDYYANLLSYTNKVFIFQNSRLDYVIDKLNSVYNTHIIVEDEAILDKNITVTFEKKEIDFILNIITKTLDLELTKTEKKFIISKKY